MLILPSLPPTSFPPAGEGSERLQYSFHLLVTLPVLIIAIIIAGVYLSFLTHDPHWLNRAGALIAAVAAPLIIVQILVEIRLEREKEAVDTRIRETNKHNWVEAPINKLKHRLEINNLQTKRSQILGRRLQVAIFVVVTVMIGELLHGFGDLIMCYGFGVCAIH